MRTIRIELHTRRHHPLRYLYRSPKANPLKAAVYATISKARKTSPEIAAIVKSTDISVIAGEINRAILRTVRDILIKNGLFPIKPDGTLDENEVNYIRQRYRMRFDIIIDVDVDRGEAGVVVKDLRVNEFHYQIRLEVANVSLPPEALAQIVRREEDITERINMGTEEEEEEGEEE